MKEEKKATSVSWEERLKDARDVNKCEESMNPKDDERFDDFH